MKPLILITNDDGVQAAGITCLAKEFCDLGEVVVFAPDGPRSGMSAALTCDKPITYSLYSQSEGLTVYSCTGTPVDCVKLAMDEVLTQKPDLLVSGINHGGNQALSIHYSGTMGAAFEGCVFDVPSMGVSLFEYSEQSDFRESCRIAKTIARLVMKNGLPHGTYLNLNIPNIRQVKGIVAARQTDGKWVREFRRETAGDGSTLFWLTGYYKVCGENYADNDVQLLQQGYASLVPCKIDVTDYDFMGKLKEWLQQ